MGILVFPALAGNAGPRIDSGRRTPTTSAQRRWPSAGPTSTVPGIVQKNTSGCRYNVQKSSVISPLMKNAPKIPRRQIGLTQAPARADGQDDGHRPRRREDETDQRVGEVEPAAVRDHLAQTGQRPVGRLQGMAGSGVRRARLCRSPGLESAAASDQAARCSHCSSSSSACSNGSARPAASAAAKCSSPSARRELASSGVMCSSSPGSCR